MTQLTDEDVLKLARLARLHLEPHEVERFRKEIAAILEYVKKLDTVSTDGLEPTYQVTGLKNVMRPDEVVQYSAQREALLKNVPSLKDDYIRTKRMIG